MVRCGSQCKKSCCLNIKPGHSVQCAELFTFDGNPLRWLIEMRIIDVTYIVGSQSFKFSVDQAKTSLYSASNVTFGKIGRLASEKVVLQLLKTVCVPIFMYSLEAFDLTKSSLWIFL